MLVVASALSGVPRTAAAGGDVQFDTGSAYCSRTSDAALKACRHGAKDDFWIAVGNCLNLSTLSQRWTCSVEAFEENMSAKEECGDQFAAREEICDAIGQAPYDPVIDPADFVDKATMIANPNPYFPLIPGTTYVYHGGGEIDTVEVTDETREILGVTALVVRDVVTDLDGEVLEDTNDWYAQDIHGNVWYFGETSKEFEDGELVSLEGSWKSGVDSAKPGIIMKALPMVGDTYRQEFSLGNAEDMGEVLSLTASASVPAVSCTQTCLQTRDFTALEPDVNEHKYYAPGIGMILEVDVDTGERVELVQVTHH